MVHIALSPNESAKIAHRSADTTDRDVFNAAMQIIIELLSIKMDLTPTMSQEHMVKSLFSMAINCTNSADLDKIAA